MIEQQLEGTVVEAVQGTGFGRIKADDGHEFRFGRARDCVLRFGDRVMFQVREARSPWAPPYAHSIVLLDTAKSEVEKAFKKLPRKGQRTIIYTRM